MLRRRSCVAKIFWLSSYPKSGNTWMRILLTNYLRNSSEPADINKLDGGPIASARIWFDEWVGVEASALEDEVIEYLRPDVYRCMAREEKETLYMKVHDAWTLTEKGEGLFPADVTAGVIYILRNPLDIATSCAHHWGVSVEQAVKRMCDPGHGLTRSQGEITDQLFQRVGSWSSHVESWLDESALPIHLVRYEDLLREPETVFGNVVKFCSLPPEDYRVHNAVIFSDFSELQRQEKTAAFRERPIKASSSFFRRGKAGAWRDELPSDLVHRLIDAHGETMRRFGYLDNNNQPI